MLEKPISRCSFVILVTRALQEKLLGSVMPSLIKQFTFCFINFQLFTEYFQTVISMGFAFEIKLVKNVKKSSKY